MDLPFRHIAACRERRLDDGVVAVRLQAVLAQHSARGDVDAAAGGVGGHHFALEILDFLDRAVGEDLKIVGAISRRAVLELVATTRRSSMPAFSIAIGNVE